MVVRKRNSLANQITMPAAVRASPVVMTNAMGDNAGNSPKRECIISSFGIVRTPTAKLVVKRSPTKASPGSVVCPSSHQTITAAASKNTKTPQNGSSAYSKASAIPGSATWESASPTRAIRFKIINPPIAPDAIPTAAAMIRDAKGGKFILRMVRFRLMFVEPAFAKKSRQILGMQNVLWFSVTQHLLIQAQDLIRIAVNNVELMRNKEDGCAALLLQSL